jgi:hypothetical protein
VLACCTASSSSRRRCHPLTRTAPKPSVGSCMRSTVPWMCVLPFPGIKPIPRTHKYASVVEQRSGAVVLLDVVHDGTAPPSVHGQGPPFLQNRFPAPQPRAGCNRERREHERCLARQPRGGQRRDALPKDVALLAQAHLHRHLSQPAQGNRPLVTAGRFVPTSECVSDFRKAKTKLARYRRIIAIAQHASRIKRMIELTRYHDRSPVDVWIGPAGRLEAADSRDADAASARSHAADETSRRRRS